MSPYPEISPSSGPFRFTADDLEPARLEAGTRQTLADFHDWQQGQPELVAEHIELHSTLLGNVTEAYRPAARLARTLSSRRNEQFEAEKLRQEIGFFCVYNIAEIPSPNTVERFRHETVGRQLAVDDLLQQGKAGGGAQVLITALQTHIPSLRRLPEMEWLEEQLTRLHRILPESVIQQGGMGKAARTLAGVLTIGAYDTLGESDAVQQAHLSRILPAAYAYGAMYPIIDDTLQDSRYVEPTDAATYDDIILRSIRTGEPVDSHELPDHPLADELLRLYDMLHDSFPFDSSQLLYKAGESMFLAQSRDSKKQIADVAPLGLTSLYPDMFMKAAMTRVVANIIGRRALPPEYFARSININFINQLRDDLADQVQDAAARRLTPFTYPAGRDDPNPLYDLLSYSAYIAHNVFHDDRQATGVLTQFSASRLAIHLLKNPGFAQEQAARSDTTIEMAQFIQQAAGLPKHYAEQLERQDIKLEQVVGGLFKNRRQTDVDPRTFVSDRREYINSVIEQRTPKEKHDQLDQAVAYALESGGKRLRPALTLMLAESLHLTPESLEPLLAAVELYHTASLVFDDLPAQDNATLRHGKPTVHLAFGEAEAQLAGIALLSSGFGALGELRQHYPANKVAEIVEYFGKVLGPDRLCRGQAMDLRMERPTTTEARPTVADIIEMYNLKTSTLLEAALIPVMILADRPEVELRAIQRFAYHAGIVFQLRDDILDATACAADTGKNSDSDVSKANIVRLYGLADAHQLMDEHLRAALEQSSDLPFDTTLLRGIVQHFAARTK